MTFLNFCKISSRKLLKLNGTFDSLPTAWGLKVWPVRYDWWIQVKNFNLLFILCDQIIIACSLFWQLAIYFYTVTWIGWKGWVTWKNKYIDGKNEVAKFKFESAFCYVTAELILYKLCFADLYKFSNSSKKPVIKMSWMTSWRPFCVKLLFREPWSLMVFILEAVSPWRRL